MGGEVYGHWSAHNNSSAVRAQEKSLIGDSTVARPPGLDSSMTESDGLHLIKPCDPQKKRVQSHKESSGKVSTWSVGRGPGPQEFRNPGFGGGRRASIMAQSAKLIFATPAQSTLEHTSECQLLCS